MAEQKLWAKKSDNGKYGIVDKEGNWLLQPEFEKAWSSEPFLIIGEGDKWAVFDAIKGGWLDDRENEFYVSVENDYEHGADLELVTDTGDVWYLFDNGDLVPEYDIDEYEENLENDEDEEEYDEDED